MIGDITNTVSTFERPQVATGEDQYSSEKEANRDESFLASILPRAEDAAKERSTDGQFLAESKQAPNELPLSNAIATSASELESPARAGQGENYQQEVVLDSSNHVQLESSAAEFVKIHEQASNVVDPGALEARPSDAPLIAPDLSGNADLVTKVSPVTTHAVAENNSAAEIYEQSLFAIGKLSYRGEGESELAVKAFGEQVRNATTKPITATVINVMSSILARKNINLANPVHTSPTNMRATENISKNSVVSAKASVIVKNSEYLKNKVTVMEKSGELSLYIRDYFSSSEDQRMLIDELFLQSHDIGRSFSRVVINGKSYFLGERG